MLPNAAPLSRRSCGLVIGLPYPRSESAGGILDAPCADIALGCALNESEQSRVVQQLLGLRSV